MPRPSFDFAALDSLLRAQARGRTLPAEGAYEAARIGPLLEFQHFTQAMPSEQRNQIRHTVHSLKPIIHSLHKCGVESDSTYTSFRIDAHKAALSSGFQPSTAAKIVAAMTELGDNIIAHSERVGSGRIAFRANSGSFEFAVADLGIGPLASLRKFPGYAFLNDHGEALSMMVEQGVSRFGPASSHGNGYRPLFTWLANLTGHLRFRAGNYSYELDGRFGDTLEARLSQKPPLKGYFASVCCFGPA